MNKRAVIDLGSNMAQLLIKTEEKELIYQDYTALAEGIHVDGVITDSSIKRAINVLTNFANLIQAKGINLNQVTFFATEACRKASNQEDFFKKIKEIGFNPQVISEADEALYGAVGVLTDFSNNLSENISLDIGGASTELALLNYSSSTNKFKLEKFVSLKMGTLLVSQKLKDNSLDTFLDKLKYKHQDDFKFFKKKNLVCTRGSMTTLFNLCLNNQKDAEETFHDTKIDSQEFDYGLSKLEKMSFEDLLFKYKYLAPRLPTLSAAISITRFLIAELKPLSIIASEKGLMHGVLKVN